MKLLYTICALALTLSSTAQVGINTNSPDLSAELDIQSTTKGILIPRMTEMQRQNITSPADGLMVYQTDGTPGFYYFSQPEWKLNGAATIGAVDYTPNINGAAVSPDGQIHLTPAAAGTSGIVTPDFQEFDGFKVFRSNVYVNGTTTSNYLEVNGNANIHNSATVNGSVTANAFFGTGITKKIPGPIDVNMYNTGDIVYVEDEGKFYFFKQGVQQSNAWNNISGHFAVFPYGDSRQLVMRMKVNSSKPISSIALSLMGTTSGTALSIYAATLNCTTNVEVDPSSLVATSSSFDGNMEFGFSNVTLTPGVEYYLQFTASPPSVLGVNHLSGIDDNFGSSYGHCSMDVGIPAMKVVHERSFTTL